jgi:hypothetical protein
LKPREDGLGGNDPRGCPLSTYMNTKLIIIITTIIGLAIFGYAYMGYKTKMDTLDKEQSFKVQLDIKESLKQADREDKLNRCKSAAAIQYQNNWKNQCDTPQATKTKDGCLLPRITANEIEEGFRKDVDNCIKLYSESK